MLILGETLLNFGIPEPFVLPHIKKQVKDAGKQQIPDTDIKHYRE
jgi:hypothetical protein